jgi:flagellar basal body-associated protein FliL
MDKDSTTITSIAIIAIVAALALLGVVAVTVAMVAEDAEAQRNKNCPRPTPVFSPGFNNTQRHCFPFP